MLITKKLNNNVALAQDDEGREVVVFGRGVGFPRTPYRLRDLSLVERVFHDVDEESLQIASNLSPDLLGVCGEIAEQVSADLQCELAPSFPFALGDHLEFAIESLKNSESIPNPLASEVAYIYPREMDCGKKALQLISARCDVQLPEWEAASIALHIVNCARGSKLHQPDMHWVFASTQAIDESLTIVERHLGISPDTSSHAFARFAAHMRYLIVRLQELEASGNEPDSSFALVATNAPPELTAVVDEISDMLQDRFGWSCSSDERLYLTMHVNRLRATATQRK